MIDFIDINQKAVPNNEDTSYKISQNPIRKSFRGSFVKKLKAVSEKQIIGN